MSEKKKVWKVPAEVLDAFERNDACRKACEKLVEKTVQHYEMAHIESQSLWKALADKLGLDLDANIYAMNHKTQEIKFVRKRTKDPEIEAMLSTVDARIAVMQEARKKIEEAIWE